MIVFLAFCFYKFPVDAIAQTNADATTGNQGTLYSAPAAAATPAAPVAAATAATAPTTDQAAAAPAAVAPAAPSPTTDQAAAAPAAVVPAPTTEQAVVIATPEAVSQGNEGYVEGTAPNNNDTIPAVAPIDHETQDDSNSLWATLKRWDTWIRQNLW